MRHSRLELFLGLAKAAGVTPYFVKVVDIKNQEWFYLTNQIEELPGYLKLKADLGENAPILKYCQAMTEREVKTAYGHGRLQGLGVDGHRIFSDTENFKAILIGPQKPAKCLVVVVQRFADDLNKIRQVFSRYASLRNAIYTTDPELALKMTGKQPKMVVILGQIFDLVNYTGEQAAREIKGVNPFAQTIIFSSVFPIHGAIDGADITIYKSTRMREYTILAKLTNLLAHGEQYQLIKHRYDTIHFRQITRNEREEPLF